MTLEDKLNISNKNIDELLEGTVEAKLICIFNDKILLDINNKLLPCFCLRKGSINKDNIFNYSKDLLNIDIEDIKIVINDDFNVRYYLLKINLEDIVNINKFFEFFEIDEMGNDIERNIISK